MYPYIRGEYQKTALIFEKMHVPLYQGVYQKNIFIFTKHICALCNTLIPGEHQKKVFLKKNMYTRTLISGAVPETVYILKKNIRATLYQGQKRKSPIHAIVMHQLLSALGLPRSYSPANSSAIMWYVLPCPAEAWLAHVCYV